MKDGIENDLQLLVEHKDILRCLEDASRGVGEVWTDLPGQQDPSGAGSTGNALPLRLIPRVADETEEGINQDNPEIRNITLQAPYRLRLFPDDCARLFREPEAAVKRFIPPHEILEAENLTDDGLDSDGHQWVVYPLLQEGGITLQPVVVQREALWED